VTLIASPSVRRLILLHEMKQYTICPGLGRFSGWARAQAQTQTQTQTRTQTQTALTGDSREQSD